MSEVLTASPDAAAEEPLLRIDFAAALSKLTRAQIQGTWQLPTEAVRLMIAAGAQSLRLEIGAAVWSLTAPGARLSRRVMADFASVLDVDLETSERHRAMVDLEGRDAFILAALGCLVAPLEHGVVVLETGAGAGTRVEKPRAGGLRVLRPQEASRPDVELRVEGLELDAERATEWLRRSARFAPIEVSVGSRALSRGFYDPLVIGEARVAPKSGKETPPLPAAVSIPRKGKAPRLWLLRHGVISTRATVPRYPCFEAAVEMSPVTEPRAAGAALREALASYVDPLIDEVTGHLVRAAGKITAETSEERRERLARLLLEAAVLERRAKEIAGLRLFPCWVGLSGPPSRRLISLDEIRRLMHLDADSTGGGILGDRDFVAIDALAPGDDARHFMLEGRVVLVLSAEERSLLGEMLGAMFSTPPPRLREAPARRAWRRLTRRFSTATVRTGRPVDENRLEADERALVVRVRTALAAEGQAPPIVVSDGDGRPHRRADGVLILPRRNEDVRRCVRVVERDPSWLYPALLVLLGGEELPPDASRREWNP